MGRLQKKLMIIILLACGIVAYSFHDFWQKDSYNQEAAAVASVPRDNVAAGGGSNPDNNSQREVVVYVSGGVNKPGVYKFGHSSRVVDAVTAAGGFAPGADAARINLAQHLKDEMQVHVPFVVNPATGSTQTGAVSSGIGSSNGDKISINMASAAELDKLPGIGPALAERIVQHRTSAGPFRDISDIKKVPGIGEAKYNQFKDKITL